MSRFLKMEEFIQPVAFVIGGLILGIIFEKWILTKLRKVTAGTKWEGNEILVNSLRGITTLWFLIAGVYAGFTDFPIKPHMLELIHKILAIALISSGTIVAARIAVGFVNVYGRRAEGVLPSTSLFANLTKVFIYSVGALIILQALGISITPILTALGVGGLAVALALQDTLSNLFAGLHILLSKQVGPGDYVKLASGEEGYVTDIAWRNTTIRALPNNMIIVPNSKLASTIVTNYYQPEKEMAVLVQVGVSYDSDLEKVERLTIEVAREIMKEVPGGVPGFEPFIRYHTYSDFSINFSVILRGKEFTDQFLIKHEFIKRLLKRYREEGINIPFPTRTVYLKEGKPPPPESGNHDFPAG